MREVDDDRLRGARPPLEVLPGLLERVRPVGVHPVSREQGLLLALRAWVRDAEDLLLAPLARDDGDLRGAGLRPTAAEALRG